MSRIENGKIELEPSKVNLEDCIKEAGDLVRTQLASKHIELDVSCNVIHKWVLCDKNRLNRALMNLLCNAGKFTDEHGDVSLRLVELAEFDDVGDYEIRVKDTGIGMSPEFVEHLFTPFERERTSTVSRTQGTGLGMAITKSIVDMMGGTIDVETEKGNRSRGRKHHPGPGVRQLRGHESAARRRQRDKQGNRPDAALPGRIRA